MFRRSVPNLDEVRQRLMQLVKESGGAFTQDHKAVFNKAEKIITRSVAEQFDGTINKDADKACEAVVGRQYFSSLPATDISSYLTLVVVVSELVMRKEVTQLARLRLHAFTNGTNYYNDLFMPRYENKEYGHAELFAKLMAQCAILSKEPDIMRMYAYSCLAVVQFQQQKFTEAKENAQKALTEYNALPDEDKKMSPAQTLLKDTQQILSLTQQA